MGNNDTDKILILMFGLEETTVVCAKGNSICIPQDYSKFDLPNETQTVVHVGIDIKDIPKEPNLIDDTLMVTNQPRIKPHRPLTYRLLSTAIKIDDKDFSITLNAFFVVRWKDERLVIDQDKIEKNLGPDDDIDAWIPVDVSFIKEFWLPDAEILNLKEFKTLDVLSKLEGLWLNRNFEIMYAVATRITFICPMTFNSFPLDVQVCLFQVCSFCLL